MPQKSLHQDLINILEFQLLREKTAGQKDHGLWGQASPDHSSKASTRPFYYLRFSRENTVTKEDESE